MAMLSLMSEAQVHVCDALLQHHKHENVLSEAALSLTAAWQCRKAGNHKPV